MPRVHPLLDIWMHTWMRACEQEREILRAPLNGDAHWAYAH